VYLESTVYRLVAEPVNPNCVANCVRPLNVPRSLTGTRAFGTGALRTCASSISRSVVNDIPELRFQRVNTFFARGESIATPPASPKVNGGRRTRLSGGSMDAGTRRGQFGSRPQRQLLACRAGR